MSFRVNMHQFEKRDNSTKRPSGDGTVLWCNLRRGSSLITPVMEFDFGAAATGNPIDYNYMYVPEFNRYYFIEDWTFSGGLWIASCICDVLATYKTEIGSTSLYILRASAASDGTIPDTMYPTKTGCTYSRTTVATPFTLTSGYFVTGIVNKTPTIGSICYYASGQVIIERMCSALLNDSTFTASGFDVQDATFALQKAIIDPLQYVKSCIYIPTVNQPDTPREEMTCNDFTLGVSVSGNVFGVEDAKETITKSFSIPKHPQTASRGNWVNGSPVTKAVLTIPPFGTIEIDTSVTANASTLTAKVDIDRPTGLGILTVSCNNMILNRMEAQVGVPVQLSEVSRDYVGAATSILSTAVVGAGAAVTGGLAIGGAISMSGSSIGDAVRSLTPREQSVGSGGSYAQLANDWTLDMQFFTVVNEDNAHFGRPYCQMAQPANLGGYMLVRDADVPIGGTSAEDARVRDYLQSGFYYE